MDKVKLEEFIKSMEEDEEGVLRKDGWWFVPDDGNAPLPGIDFNREIIGPNANEDFPDGALGIRVDDDFWAVAVLPYKFADLSIEDIVAVLWPKIEDPIFKPDSCVE